MTEPHSAGKRTPPDDLVSHRDSMFRNNPEYRDAYNAARQVHGIIDALVGLRKQQGLTQIDMAKLMGVKQPTVSGFENETSDPKLSTLQRYSSALDALLNISVSHPLLPEQIPDTVEELRSFDGNTNAEWTLQPVGESRGEAVTSRSWSFEITDPALVEALSGSKRRSHLDLAVTAETSNGHTRVEGRIPLRTGSGTSTAMIVLQFDGTDAEVSVDLAPTVDSDKSRSYDMTGSTETDVDFSKIDTHPKLTLKLR